jgi:hypothetical protein
MAALALVALAAVVGGSLLIVHWSRDDAPIEAPLVYRRDAVQPPEDAKPRHAARAGGAAL